MSSPASRIVIIGAGIGGLTLALLLLLRRRGIIAEILEQAPELREVGAAVSLAANGTRVLQHLDLGDGLAQASSEFAAAVRQYEARRRVRTRQVQVASWATSAVLHLPDGPAAQVRDAYLASLPERLAWIHGYDILAQSPGKGSPRRRRGRLTGTGKAESIGEPRQNPARS